MRKQFPFSLIILSSLLITTCEKNPVDSSIQEQYKIAFASDDSLYVMNWDGTDQKGIFSLGASSFGVLWSPDGGKISFDEYRLSIEVINPDGTNHISLTAARSGASRYSWSPDGKRIVFSARFFPAGIYVIDINDFSKQRITEGGSPMWSPGDNRIAYLHQGKIHVINSDGSNKTKLTDTLTTVDTPRWSPDGTKIVFMAKGNTFVMNADGTNKIKLTDVPYIQRPPVWSPDGSKLVYVNYNEPRGLSMMNIDGGNIEHLTTEGGFPAWSPDGRYLAYTSNDGIFLVKPDGTDNVKLTNKWSLFEIAWSPVPLP